MSNTRRPFTELQQEHDFIQRHIGPSDTDKTAMLATLGFDSMATLVDKVIPSAIRLQTPLALDDSCSEQRALVELKAIAQRNKIFKSMIGMGYYNCYTPTVILRNVLENPAWYTAYTPYQPEISQGRLEALLNFQTMVAELTGMEIANASLLDEATAAAEAMTFCQRLSKNRSKTFFVSKDCHPQTISVIQTRAAPIGIDVVIGDHTKDLEHLDYFGVLLQYPTSTGEIYDYSGIVAKAHANNALVVVAADLLSLTLLQAPGEFGADVAVGNSQRFGVPLGYGGPHAAYFATKDTYKRLIPGRLVGVSIDSKGDKAYRLAMQTREQHIRREKATSNICTAQALLAVIASLYAVYHGPEGLRTIAERVHRLTATLAAGLRQLGYTVPTQAFFDTVTVAVGERSQAIHEAVRGQGINLRAVDAETIGISLDETTSTQDIMTLWALFANPDQEIPPFAELEQHTDDQLPPALLRNSEFLTHPIFNRYHSETELLRYMRLLADKDLALDRAMIPLGSCTMKLNATTELIPITWPEFGQIHPFAPHWNKPKDTSVYSKTWKNGYAPALAMMRYPYNLMPVPRANMPVSWQFALIIRVAAKNALFV